MSDNSRELHSQQIRVMGLALKRFVLAASGEERDYTLSYSQELNGQKENGYGFNVPTAVLDALKSSPDASELPYRSNINSGNTDYASIMLFDQCVASNGIALQDTPDKLANFIDILNQRTDAIKGGGFSAAEEAQPLVNIVAKAMEGHSPASKSQLLEVLVKRLEKDYGISLPPSGQAAETDQAEGVTAARRRS